MATPPKTMLQDFSVRWIFQCIKPSAGNITTKLFNHFVFIMKNMINKEDTFWLCETSLSFWLRLHQSLKLTDSDKTPILARQIDMIVSSKLSSMNKIHSICHKVLMKFKCTIEPNVLYNQYISMEKYLAVLKYVLHLYCVYLAKLSQRQRCLHNSCVINKSYNPSAQYIHYSSRYFQWHHMGHA